MVDVFYPDLATILEANVNAIADAFIDNRRDTDAAGLGERLEPRSDVNAVAVDIVPFDNNVAKIDADAQHDRRRCAVRIGRQGGRALYGERAVYGIDDTAELDNGAVTDQFYNPAVMGGNGGVENDLTVPLQGTEGAGLIGSHQPGIANDIGRKNRPKLTVDPSSAMYSDNPTGLEHAHRLRSAPFGKIHGRGVSETKRRPLTRFRQRLQCILWITG